MTFEHGRIKTWRLPRFSAFEMDLRQSARTCGEKGEGSVLAAALVMCVLHRELCGGAWPPALPGRGHERRRRPGSSSAGPWSRRRPAKLWEAPASAAVIASRASRARVARRQAWVGRLGAPRPRLSCSEAKHKMQAYGPRR